MILAKDWRLRSKQILFPSTYSFLRPPFLTRNCVWSQRLTIWIISGKISRIYLFLYFLFCLLKYVFWIQKSWRIFGQLPQQWQSSVCLRHASQIYQLSSAPPTSYPQPLECWHSREPAATVDGPRCHGCWWFRVRQLGKVLTRQRAGKRRVMIE